MTARKFKNYTLWVKWRQIGWEPILNCSNPTNSDINPIEVLEYWFRDEYVNLNLPYWKRGKTWMILPSGRKPKGVK